MTTVAVVGGGIAGLAAALRLRDRLGPAAQITVYEAASYPGGKLRTGSLAGVTLELAADAFLVRDPGTAGGAGQASRAGQAIAGQAGTTGDSAAVALAKRVGLGDELVHPQPLPAALVLDGALRPIPAGTLLGVPGDLAKIADVAQPEPERDRDDGRPLLAAGADVAVGELVRRRLGDQVVDRLVDPMLGGVYAGRPDALSLAATMPRLAAACATETTLVGAVRAALAATHRPASLSGAAEVSAGSGAGQNGGAGVQATDLPRGSPMFASVRGGLGRLAAAVAATSKATLRVGAPVRELAPAAAGWRLVLGSTRDPELVEADAVVLALPARPAARLLRGVSEPAAGLVGELDYASVALVTLALPPGTELPELTGFLVPTVEGLTMKAATFVGRKWPERAGDGLPVLVRASVGRFGAACKPNEECGGAACKPNQERGGAACKPNQERGGEPEPLRLTDQALAARVHAELAWILPGLPEPVATRVQRWGGALPQYAPGHAARVAAARATLPSTLALAGAGYDGVGIPACVHSGQNAADTVAGAVPT